MYGRLTVALFAVCALASVAGAQAVFDRLQKEYAPFMDATDSLAFPLKVHVLAESPYKFWRGSKDLYYSWCQAHANDWLADKDAYLTSHGDLHFGNIGTYPAGEFGKLAFGLVDFDESCRTPVQLELMQGLITLHLTARYNKLQVDDRLIQTLIDSYRQSLTSTRTAEQLLADEPAIKKLLSDAGRSYAKHELAKVTNGGRFVPAVKTKDGQIKDLYRPAMDRADEFAAAIEQAMANSTDLRARLRFNGRASIKDAALRTRLGSSGSQGLKKYVILLDRPLKDRDHDLVLYLKQEIPAAGERAGVSPVGKHTPGERVARNFAALAYPSPLMSSWCEIGDESYWVSFKEPWSEELDPGDFDTPERLVAAARIWGVVAGCSHRRDPNAAALAGKLTLDESVKLRERSKAFSQQLDADYAEFTRDVRTVAVRKAVAETAVKLGRSD